MATTFPESPTDANREREIAEARTALLSRAAAQGVEVFTSLEDFAGESALVADFDIDEFLRQVREDRERTSTPNNE